MWIVDPMVTPRSKVLIVLLLVLIVVSGCRKQEESAPEVLVRVNGRAVTLAEFRREFARILPPDQTLSAAERGELERSFLVQLIDRELTLAEAQRLGVSLDPGAVDAAVREYRSEYPGDSFTAVLREQGLTPEQWRRELKRSLLMEKVMRQAVDARVMVSDAEIEDYFKTHQDQFDRPEQVRARQIVVAGEEEGKKALAGLHQGRSFAEVAREVSLSPDAEQGGDLGFFGRGEMPPEFDAAVFTLEPGQVSDLVKSDYGYHIFLVEERRSARRLNLPQVREQIREQLLADKRQRAYQDWLQELRSKATIEMNWSLM